MREDEPPPDLGLAKAPVPRGVGTWQLNIPRRRFTWSKATADLFGLERTFAADQRTFLARVHPRERERVAGQFHSAISSGAATFLEFRIRSQAGRLRWVGCLGQAGLRDDGPPRVMVGIVFDVSEQPEPENRELDALLATLPEGPQRLVLSLACIGRLDYREIAEHTGLPRGLVRAHLRRGWQRLAGNS